MFSGIAWYWWPVIAAAVLSIPLKIKFMKWWSNHRQGKEQRGKWGDDE